MKFDLSKASEIQIAKDLALLSEVVARTQVTKEPVIWEFDGAIEDHSILAALLVLFKESSSKKIISQELDSNTDILRFNLNSEEANNSVKQVEANISADSLFPTILKVPLSYLLDELVCNMQQHSGCKEGCIFAKINHKDNTLDILIADNGITIYGSYVNAGRYLEFIGESSAEALNLAKDGYSTKNRPNAENRGYGISSNAKMVVKGLHGCFSIISGAAVYHYTEQAGHQIIGSADFFEWNGTAVIARIPLNVPKDFSFYDYIA